MEKQNPIEWHAATAQDHDYARELREATARVAELMTRLTRSGWNVSVIFYSSSEKGKYTSKVDIEKIMKL
jgi:hypothetical protein